MRAILPLLASLILTIPLAISAPAPLDNPIANGGFDLPFMPDEVDDLLANTPADECIGIGHQANFGTDTWQEDASNGISALATGDPDNATAHAVGGANRWSEDPVEEALFTAGYGYCVWSDEEGYDYAWIHPRDSATKPAGWSRDIRDPSVEFGTNLPGDPDPFNRAAVFTAGEGAGINLWQSYLAPHRAWSGNHQTLGLDVLSGEIPKSASIQIILSTSPLEEMGQWVVLDEDCSLTYSGQVLRENLEDGRVTVDPVDNAVFRARTDACRAAAEAWGEGSPDERREVLGRLQMFQFTFWSWNSGNSDVVVDNIEMAGTTPWVEEAANGNENLLP